MFGIIRWNNKNGMCWYVYSNIKYYLPFIIRWTHVEDFVKTKRCTLFLTSLYLLKEAQVLNNIIIGKIEEITSGRGQV